MHAQPFLSLWAKTLMPVKLTLSSVACLMGGLVAQNAVAETLQRVSPSLENPWGMSFVDADRLLVTERPGQVSLVDLRQRSSIVLSGVPETVVGGQGGMLDVLYDQGEVFLCYTGKASLGMSATTLGKGRLAGDRLDAFQVLFQASNPGYGFHHFGCRIGIDPQGYVFLSVGDRLDADSAQDPATHLGTVIRLNRDGSVPTDNPLVGQAGAQPEIYSYGHRNPQGMSIHPTTGEVWLNEHGPQGGDEINIIGSGENYGWPLLTHGEQYGGGAIGIGSSAPGYADSVWHWTPSIAPSDMTFVPEGSQFPQYEGDLLVTSLKFKSLYHVRVEGETVTGESVILDRRLGRLRDVEVGPDGAIYLLNDESKGGVYRLSVE